MTPATKLAAFALVLLAAFGLGSALGAEFGPIDVRPAEHQAPEHEAPEHEVPEQHEPTGADGATSTTHAPGHVGDPDHPSTTSSSVLR